MSETREVPAAVEGIYRQLCDTPSDINEHLPTLRKYAAECEHVTEMGMRGATSTVALMAAQPQTLISWDINPLAVTFNPMVQHLVRNPGRTSFQPRVGDTLKIEIEPTDMLFIDTLHTYAQLRAELERHGDKVKKYLAFHDTVTFGWEGEDGKAPGLREAVKEFQLNRFPLWELVEDSPDNNGLIVLKRHWD